MVHIMSTLHGMIKKVKSFSGKIITSLEKKPNIPQEERQMCKNNIFVQSKDDKDIFRIFKKKKYYKIRTVRLSLSLLMICMVLMFGVGTKNVFIYLRGIWIIPHYKRINILQRKRKSGNNSALVLAPVLYTNLLTYYVFPKKTLAEVPTIANIDCQMGDIKYFSTCAILIRAATRATSNIHI